MSPILFLTPFPIPRYSCNKRSTCVRRPRTVACTSKPPESDHEAGEPSWTNLARDISPADSDDPPRPPPEWQYPEGDPRNVGQDNPWKKWNAAVDNQTPLEERDVKAETDFWRSAARQITPESDASPSIQNSDQPPPIAALGDDILTDEPTNSEQVWDMARGVTGQMTDLQDKLRGELERYNPEEKTDQYRDIARELVGPPDDPWDNSEPVRTSDVEAESGSGWNPDVDWMRFDDVRREQAKQVEKAQREEAERFARQQMDAITDSSTDFVTAGEDDLTKTFTDQSVDESFIMEPSSGSLPGFLTNRMRSSGTYGGSWTDADEEASNLQAQGIPLRDPKADTDAWRSVARELNLEVSVDTHESTALDVTQNEDIQALESDGETDIPDVVNRLEDITLSEKEPQLADAVKKLGEDQSPWSSWRSGEASWQAANEKVPERDPAKEVDMWRSSARELISETSVSPTTSVDIKPDDEADKTLRDEADKTPRDEGSAWDQWRSANAHWESTVAATSEDSWRTGSDNQWSEADRSDWGASLGSKTTSERSAWEQWNNVSGMSSSTSSSSWWNNRTDLRFTNTEKPDRSFNNADEWRSTARETLNVPEQKKEGQAPPSRDMRVENDTSLDSWRSMAKDLIEDQE